MWLVSPLLKYILMRNALSADSRRNDISPESADALSASTKGIVLAETGLRIRVEREMLLARKEGGKNISRFVVALPQDATPEQLAEADYWLNELVPLFRYAQLPLAEPT